MPHDDEVFPDATKNDGEEVLRGSQENSDHLGDATEKGVGSADDPALSRNVAEDEEAPQEREPSDADTFPREYVEKLRDENAKYRQRAQKADAYAQRLHTELVRATGKLADPTDLPYNPEHVGDPEKLAAAITELLAKKPHLASRRVTGDIGQGTTSKAALDLAALLRAKAG